MQSKLGETSMKPVKMEEKSRYRLIGKKRTKKRELQCKVRERIQKSDVKEKRDYT